MTDRWAPDWGIVGLTAGSTAAYLGLAAAGWGGWTPLLADPARAGACLVVAGLALASVFTRINLAGCATTDSRGWWVLFPVAGVVLGSAWLASWADRRDVGTFGPGWVRWAGLGLLVVGGVMRVGPMFRLGARFTWPLASQGRCPLVTTGFYRRVRHPSYAGGLVGMAGWMLVFRSAAGLALVGLVVPAVIGVIRAEEASLLAEHGDTYAAYRRRTWRLIPYLY